MARRQMATPEERAVARKKMNDEYMAKRRAENNGNVAKQMSAALMDKMKNNTVAPVSNKVMSTGRNNVSAKGAYNAIKKRNKMLADTLNY